MFICPKCKHSLSIEDCYCSQCGNQIRTKMEGSVSRGIIVDESTMKTFGKIVEPVMKFLNNNFHPHMKIVIDCTHAELLEASCGIHTEKFIKG